MRALLVRIFIQASILLIVGCSQNELHNKLITIGDEDWHMNADQCGMSFSPEPELLEDTLDAAARWSAATGCDVRVAEGGLPVTVQVGMVDGYGKPVNGRALVYSDAQTGAYARCDGFIVSTIRAANTVAHEMGHCLGAMGHTESGLMAEHSNGGDMIDADSLSLVCENANCPAIRPEM